jgi:hypothetical protein
MLNSWIELEACKKENSTKYSNRGKNVHEYMMFTEMDITYANLKNFPPKDKLKIIITIKI